MLTWPTSDRLKVYCLQGGLLTVLFVLVYGTTNALAMKQVEVFHLWMPFELQIPLIPEFIFIYISLNILTLIPLFALSVSDLKNLGQSMGLAILLAGVIFYFVPAPIGFIRPLEVDRYNSIFQFIYRIDHTANTFPSLHVALSFLCVRFLARLHRGFWIWLFFICLSVLLTHQHHLIDIAGGLILGEICFRVFQGRRK